jgi:hypothetical protein
MIPLALVTLSTRQKQRKPSVGAGDFASNPEPFGTIVWQLGNVSELHEPGGRLRSSLAGPRLPASRGDRLRGSRASATTTCVNATPRVAVAGGIWRANRDAIGRTMRNDSRHGIATTMVFAEHRTQKAPDGPNGAEHSVAKPDAMFVKSVSEAGLRQDVREREPLIARKASAHRIQVRHGIAFKLTAIPAA